MLPNIGPIELIVILIIALIVIGPGRLPDVGAALGKSIKEFRKASSDISDAARVDAAATPAGGQPTSAPVDAGTAPAQPGAAPASSDPLAAPSAAAPPAAPAPTPELSRPAPTTATLPAPIQVPPVDDGSAHPPA